MDDAKDTGKMKILEADLDSTLFKKGVIRKGDLNG